MTGPRRRVTQQDIARLTGVSQATVSLVLNGRTDADVRIAPETRDRVLRAIQETGYVADPVARRLAAQHNRIIGVFTYEAVFPSGTGDFYHPFLVGIEERAESLGCDLLLLTSAPVVDGRRRIFHEDNRLRLADGCVLSDVRWTATSWPGSSPTACRSSRSAAATTPAGRSRTSAPTTPAGVSELVAARGRARAHPPCLPRPGRRARVARRPHARLRRGRQGDRRDAGATRRSPVATIARNASTSVPQGRGDRGLRRGARRRVALAVAAAGARADRP